jgi:hypothetical protein
MAAMPCADGRRASAFITKVENAKKIPATSPESIADAKRQDKDQTIHLLESGFILFYAAS